MEKLLNMSHFENILAKGEIIRSSFPIYIVFNSMQYRDSIFCLWTGLLGIFWLRFFQKHRPRGCQCYSQEFPAGPRWPDDSRNSPVVVLALHAGTVRLGRWDVFQQFAFSGEELMSGRVDTSCTTPLVIHDYDKAFEALHMHKHIK